MENPSNIHLKKPKMKTRNPQLSEGQKSEVVRQWSEDVCDAGTCCQDSRTRLYDGNVESCDLAQPIRGGFADQLLNSSTGAEKRDLRATASKAAPADTLSLRPA